MRIDTWKGSHVSVSRRAVNHDSHSACEVWAVVEEPIGSRDELREGLEVALVEDGNGEQGDEANHAAHFHWVHL
jgi:hypothetical protein